MGKHLAARDKRIDRARRRLDVIKIRRWLKLRKRTLREPLYWRLMPWFWCFTPPRLPSLAWLCKPWRSRGRWWFLLALILVVVTALDLLIMVAAYRHGN